MLSNSNLLSCTSLIHADCSCAMHDGPIALGFEISVGISSSQFLLRGQLYRSQECEVADEILFAIWQPRSGFGICHATCCTSPRSEIRQRPNYVSSRRHQQSVLQPGLHFFQRRKLSPLVIETWLPGHQGVGTMSSFCYSTAVMAHEPSMLSNSNLLSCTSLIGADCSCAMHDGPIALGFQTSVGISSSQFLLRYSPRTSRLLSRCVESFTSVCHSDHRLRYSICSNLKILLRHSRRKSEICLFCFDPDTAVCHDHLRLQ